MIKARVSLFCWGILILIIGQIYGAPLASENDVNEDYLLEDMVFEVLRNGVVAPARRWPNGIVYYRISDEFEQFHKDAILTAMKCLEDVSCVRFYEAKRNVKNYVNIIPSEIGTCSAMLGYRGGEQRLQLAKERPKCFNPIIVAHELLHTLGFFHEHMASDRDDFITINWENIRPGREIFYMKLDNKTATDFGYGYDYESILHYGPKSFSDNGLPTITALDSNANIGQRDHLSPKDIGKLNAMYNCPLKVEENENQEAEQTGDGGGSAEESEEGEDESEETETEEGEDEVEDESKNKIDGDDVEESEESINEINGVVKVELARKKYIPREINEISTKQKQR